MNEMDACDSALADALITMVEWQNQGRFVEEPGMLFAIGGSRFPAPYSNAAFPMDASADADRLLDRAARLFSDRRYFVWGRGKEGGRIGELARSHAFLPMGELPAMVIERRVEPSRTDGIQVVRVNDAAGFSEFVEIAKRSYLEASLPEAITSRWLERSEAALQSSVVAVARSEGHPVAGALAITNAATGIGGVYWVGTVPEARRRGAADAVTRFVTNAAFDQGATIVTLQASAAGEPVYRRMGYLEVGRYERLLSPGT